MQLTILGIESSCDETSAAVMRDRRVLSNVIASQAVHERYGGVVPELASRAHQSNIVPVVNDALQQAGISLAEIDAIAYTVGPGLIGALMVGSSFAKGLSIALDKPLIEVHHMKAHVMAHFIDDDAQRVPETPFLCLTVSGGHTQIVLVASPTEQIVLGNTIDDAAGEAFDKSAKILGLPYPGGPVLDQLAQTGDPNRYSFSKSNIPGLDFSFSGLKTSVLYFVRDAVRQDPDFVQREIHHLCAGVQKAITDMLIDKLVKASREHGIRRLAIAGGVSANSELRKRMSLLQADGFDVFLPQFGYCTDNAAMIAIYGHFHYLEHHFGSLSTAPKARMPY